MTLELFMALRYLRAKRKQLMLSVITILSTAGVAIGVCALIIVLAVMTGFAGDLRDKILGANSHGVVFSRYDRGIKHYSQLLEKIESTSGVVAAAPFIYQQAIVRRKSRVSGVVVKGVSPDLSRRVVTISEHMSEGSLDCLVNARGAGEKKSPEGVKSESFSIDTPGVVLGEELAATLGVTTDDKIILVSPFGTNTPMGMVPKSREFRVCGIFTTGMYDYDSSWMLISLPEAQDFFDMGSTVSGIELRMNDPFRAESISDKLMTTIGRNYYVRSWMNMNQSFFEALKLEKIAMFIILLFIIAVAAFGIVSSLMMMVMEKNKDIGILKAMGASSRTVMLIFMLQGVVIGIMGTAIGAILGVGLSWIADTYKLITLSGDVYYITHLPFSVQLRDVVLTCTLSVLISFIATLYPARMASSLDPVEAIRYE